ncbi:hypothetical protein HK104_000643 [Borealophlyctis nickersoniae]|nr:hypothetical protein HK104_000643 [Borealophlyctis nickersoniae]
MSTIVNKATETANTAVAYATQVAGQVAGQVDPYVPQAAKDAATYAIGTATAAKDYATSTAANTHAYVSSRATGAYEATKGAVQSTTTTVTTTVTAYTPSPVMNLINASLDSAKAIRADPVGTVKPYVPTFVIHAGEKTYEVVHDVQEKTKENISATSGYIVEKVNGTVQTVTSIPQVAQLIEQLDKLTKGGLSMLGVPTKTGEVQAETVEGAVKEQ